MQYVLVPPHQQRLQESKAKPRTLVPRPHRLVPLPSPPSTNLTFAQCLTTARQSGWEHPRTPCDFLTECSPELQRSSVLKRLASFTCSPIAAVSQLSVSCTGSCTRPPQCPSTASALPGLQRTPEDQLASLLQHSSYPLGFLLLRRATGCAASSHC